MLFLPQETQVAIAKYETTGFIQLNHLKKCKKNKTIYFENTEPSFFYTREKRYFVSRSNQTYESIEELIAEESGVNFEKEKISQYTVFNNNVVITINFDQEIHSLYDLMLNSIDLLKEISVKIEHKEELIYNVKESVYYIYLNEGNSPFAKFEFKNKSSNNGSTVRKFSQKSIFEIFKILHKETNVTYFF